MRRFCVAKVITAVMIVAPTCILKAGADTTETGHRSPILRLPVVWRTTAHESANCCYLLLRANGIYVDYGDLLTELPQGGRADLLSIRDVCRRHGLQSVVEKWKPTQLRNESLPVIAHLSSRLDEGGTFVLLMNRDDENCFTIIGSSAMFRSFSFDWFRRNWSGYVLTARSNSKPWATQMSFGVSLVILSAYLFYRLFCNRLSIKVT